MEKTVKIKVFGRVQGVYFRYFTKEHATKNGIRGTVQNIPDGTVEIIAQGIEKQIEDMIQWAHKGSPGSKVEQVIVEEIFTDTKFDSFSILR